MALEQGIKKGDDPLTLLDKVDPTMMAWLIFISIMSLPVFMILGILTFIKYIISDICGFLSVFVSSNLFFFFRKNICV